MLFRSPDGHGDRLCRWIRDRWRELPIIFLTVRSDASDIVSGFRDGADDYVVKPFQLEVLHSRILALLRRTGNVAEQYLSCGGIRIDRNRRTVTCQSEEIPLSAAEYQPRPWPPSPRRSAEAPPADNALRFHT